MHMYTCLCTSSLQSLILLVDTTHQKYENKKKIKKTCVVDPFVRM